MKKFFNLIALCLILLFMLLIISNPVPCKNGAVKGLLLCGRVIIPSLFPFTVCVLFIIKSGILNMFSRISPITKRLFRLDGELFAIVLLSFIGGYPIGAKMLGETVAMKKLSPEKAGVMLNFCINAGPAFIIIAVGEAVLNSRKLGAVLFAAHILSSLIICVISRNFLKESNTSEVLKIKNINPADNFTLSVSGAATSMLSICSFVIMFSCIDAYLIPLSQSAPTLKLICGLLEVTNSLTLTRNIYMLSFFLGFSGICIWFQIFSMSSDIKFKPLFFILFRILHGILSVIITRASVMLFNITVPTLSNNREFSSQPLFDTPALAISMLMMGIVFAVALTTRKYNCKLSEDVV